MKKSLIVSTLAVLSLGVSAAHADMHKEHGKKGAKEAKTHQATKPITKGKSATKPAADHATPDESMPENSEEGEGTGY
ncbi:MAG: hypothetical protein KDD34_10095 [Bdellovibrionales bacterium]|nr:hypothetical protein [Bdellovibrionales bacterium]